MGDCESWEDGEIGGGILGMGVKNMRVIEREWEYFILIVVVIYIYICI